MHASFRVMFGEWDWNAMKGISRTKAGIWFWIFMLLMVLVLLNMLLAILMESYSQVKGAAGQSPTLCEQVITMMRRFRESRAKQRVRLNEVWDMVLDSEGGDQEGILKDSNEKVMYPKELQGIVTDMTFTQAERTMKNAQKDFNQANEPGFGPEDLKEPLNAMAQRVDNTVLCSAYLSAKAHQYQKLEEQFLTGTTGDGLDGMDGAQKTPQGTPSPAAEGIAKLRMLTKERTEELGNGIFVVLAHEMDALERRQREQHRNLEQMGQSFKDLRSLVYRLHATCADVADQMTTLRSQDGDEGGGAPRLPAGGNGFERAGNTAQG
eukprot:gnl/TRDRNA2_/TRDRNA2_143081_c1_seq1.p1 gnl/TRDRNA2_/TRDRNA2_143081_c1~~gnl/TRDRNA2_/TRDRNA2_143081_c1_seq1.p1  ORF type:complete len:322 (-),score=78.16 gnl/TRDRNA2_/TRDRNA2_143081_c1_seq1:72-1037(-)